MPLGNSNSICRAQPANGLLLIHSSSERRIHICNPITREYIELWCPDECISLDYLLYYGLSVSKISGQYKVVCINGDARSNSHHVYTLGTRTWRRVEAGAASGFTFCFNAYIVYAMETPTGQYLIPLMSYGFVLLISKQNVLASPLLLPNMDLLNLDLLWM